MIAIHTARDRQIHRLQQEIRQCEIWIEVDAGDRRAAAWHRAKLAELIAELEELERTDP
jgi:hypothetical protein